MLFFCSIISFCFRFGFKTGEQNGGSDMPLKWQRQNEDKRTLRGTWGSTVVTMRTMKIRRTIKELKWSMKCFIKHRWRISWICEWSHRTFNHEACRPFFRSNDINKKYLFAKFRFRASEISDIWKICFMLDIYGCDEFQAKHSLRRD